MFSETAAFFTAKCSEPFIELNDTNCYFISDDWVQYQDAKQICTLLDSEVYIPPPGSDYVRAGIYHQILEYLTYDM